MATASKRPVSRLSLSFGHAKPQIGSRRGLEYPRSFESHLLIGARLEKAKAVTQKDGNNANMDLVHQPGA